MAVHLDEEKAQPTTRTMTERSNSSQSSLKQSTLKHRYVMDAETVVTHLTDTVILGLIVIVESKSEHCVVAGSSY